MTPAQTAHAAIFRFEDACMTDKITRSARPGLVFYHH